MYMAPEIYLHYNEATAFSDMWSFACTIIELYKKTPVWHLTDSPQNCLEQLLKEKRKPILIKLSDILYESISNCFNYESGSRPKARQVIQAMKAGSAELLIE